MSKFIRFKTNIYYYCLTALLFLPASSMDVSAQILNEDYAAGADILILKNEMGIFSTIQEGVRLSVAECEIFDSCDASVNRDELSQLISTINGRINSLSVRYSDTGEAALEEVLVGYVDIRDGYNEILEKIESLPQFEVKETPVDEFGFDGFFGFGPATTNEVSPEIQQLFEDADEELSDDILTDDVDSQDIP